MKHLLSRYWQKMAEMRWKPLRLKFLFDGLLRNWTTSLRNLKTAKFSATGTQTQVSWVNAKCDNHLHHDETLCSTMGTQTSLYCVRGDYDDHLHHGRLDHEHVVRSTYRTIPYCSTFAPYKKIQASWWCVLYRKWDIQKWYFPERCAKQRLFVSERPQG